MTLREEIRTSADEIARRIYEDQLSMGGAEDVIESAILAGIKLVLEREPSEQACAFGLDASAICIKEYYANGKYTGSTRSFSDKECGDIYRAMIVQLLKELE
jgi:hypothetical protein